MFKKFFIIISFIGIITLITNNTFSKEKEYVTLDRNIKAKTISILQKTKGLKYAGFGGKGSEKLELSILAFDRDGDPLNIAQARDLLVFAVETFLKEFNTNKKIKPYLINYPFTFKNIGLRIFLHDHKSENYPPPHLTSVALYEGIVYFGKKDKELKLIHEEPYEKALEIVEKNKMIK